MFGKEELDNWNEVFINGKIHETDIKCPTETFLVRTLTAYLQAFGYNVEIPNENRMKRLFLIRLAASIDRMLKVTDKSNAFYYYDLVQPVPKKTSKVFGILLNYYFFYKMVKKEVFAMSNESIKAHEELLLEIKITQTEIQERKDRVEKIENEISSLSKMVPTIKTQLDAWKSEKDHKEVQLQKEHEELEDLNKKLKTLKPEERNLRKQIVEDKEANNLKIELTDLKNNIEERLSMKVNLESVLNERMMVIKEMESLLKRLEQAKNIFPLTFLDEYKGVCKKLKQSKIQHENLARKNETLLEIISKQEIKLKSMEEEFKKKRQQFGQEKVNKLAAIQDKQILRTSEKHKLELLKDQLKKDSNELQEYVQTRAFLKDAIQKLLAHYTNGTRYCKFQ